MLTRLLAESFGGSSKTPFGLSYRSVQDMCLASPNLTFKHSRGTSPILSRDPLFFFYQFHKFGLQQHMFKLICVEGPGLSFQVRISVHLVGILVPQWFLTMAQGVLSTMWACPEMGRKNT